MVNQASDITCLSTREADASNASRPHFLEPTEALLLVVLLATFSGRTFTGARVLEPFAGRAIPLEQQWSHSLYVGSTHPMNCKHAPIPGAVGLSMLALLGASATKSFPWSGCSARLGCNSAGMNLGLQPTISCRLLCCGCMCRY